jgi:hypothetical protein
MAPAFIKRNCPKDKQQRRRAESKRQDNPADGQGGVRSQLQFHVPCLDILSLPGGWVYFWCREVLQRGL